MCELHRPDDADAERLASISTFVDELVVAITSRRVYWSDHPRVTDALATVLRLLRRHIEEAESDRLEIGYSEGYLFHDKRPLLGASLSAPRIIRPLADLKAGGLYFSRRATERDLLALVEVLGRKTMDLADHREANQVLSQNGADEVRILPKYDPGSTDEDWREAIEETLATTPVAEAEPVPTNLNLPRQMYQDVVYHLQDVMVQVCRGGTMSI
ncbi:MAG: hypothetical protein ACYTG6_11230, partial [Planctomycetota bacterium]